MTRLLAALVIVALAATGCSSRSHEGGTTAATGATTAPPDVPTEDWNDPQPAEGADTSYPACDVPATFDLAEKWTAKAVPADLGDLAGALGPHAVACEIDGKPAGVIGFIRVFRASGADARAALMGQIGGNPAGLRTREFTAPAGAGWEASYGPADKPERAFAVAVGADTVIVHWSGLDEEEHKAGLPAYLLAQASIARRG